MDQAGHLRAEAIDRVQLTDQTPSPGHGRQPSADAQAVARSAAQRDFQVVPPGELILVENHRAATRLPQHQIELAIVAEIAGHYATAIAVAVRSRQSADVEKVPAAHVEESALTLESTEVVSLFDDVPGVLGPELIERGIEFPGKRTARPPMPGL
jgi:hypothetical protein